MNLLKKLSKFGNGTFDYSVVHGAEIGKDKLAEISIIRGGVSTGVQRLVQQYIIELLTPSGSMEYSDSGCDFSEDVLGSVSDDRVRTAFSFANARITGHIVSSETDNMALDERLDYAELTDVSFIGDTVSISVAIHTKAGTEYDVVLPIYSI